MSPLSQVYSPTAGSVHTPSHSNSPQYRSDCGSPTISSPSTRSSQTQSPVEPPMLDGNLRLQEKIMMHLHANKDYKSKTSPISSRTQSPVANNTPQRVQSPLTHSPLVNQPQSVLSPTNQPQRVLSPTTQPQQVLSPTNQPQRLLTPINQPQHMLSPTNQSPVNNIAPLHQQLRRAASSPMTSGPSIGMQQYRPVSHPTSAPSNTPTQQYKPISQLTQNRRHSANIETVISPHTPPAVPNAGLRVLPLSGDDKINQLRSAPLDTAVPQSSLRRMPGSRKRMPLSDMIMQRKIADSLKRSLTSGLNLSSPVGIIPSVQTANPTSPHSSGQMSPLSPTNTLSGTRARSPSPPVTSYYMKAWQASEVAKSVATSGPGLAIAQQPVKSQELPPRLKSRGDNTPPERPPKSRALFIEKL